MVAPVPPVLWVSERSEHSRVSELVDMTAFNENRPVAHHSLYICTASLTGRPDDAADVKDNVLTGDALAQLSIDANQHILGLGLRESARGQDVLHLRRANAKGHRAERAVSRRVRIAADGRAARQRESLLGTDDVDDALPLVGHAKVLEAEILHVLLELEDLRAGGGLLDEGLDGNEVGPIGGGDVVIDRYQGAIGPADRAIGQAEALKGLRGGDLL